MKNKLHNIYGDLFLDSNVTANKSPVSTHLLIALPVKLYEVIKICFHLRMAHTKLSRFTVVSILTDLSISLV